MKFTSLFYQPLEPYRKETVHIRKQVHNSSCIPTIPPRSVLQFSDHELVRRASTEALCNLLPHPKMVDHLKVVDNLKLWAAFAQLGMEDPPTAAAALGCLAMAVRDPEVKEQVNENYQYNIAAVVLLFWAGARSSICAA